MLTEREKGFVLNGIRSYLRLAQIDAGQSPDQADEYVDGLAEMLEISPQVMRTTDGERQHLLELICKYTGVKITGP